MEIDQFIAENQSTWQRLEQLAARVRSRTTRIKPGELDELLGLYDIVSVHLSQARARYDDTVLTDGLSRSLGSARAAIYGSPGRGNRPIRTFFSVALPAAIYQTRRAIAVAALLTLVPAVGIGVWLSGSPDVRDAAVDRRTQELISSQSFEGYYSSNPAQAWVFELFTHNIEVTLLTFGLGALGAVGGIAILVQNAFSIGTMAAVMHAAGKGELFWGLIVPHGLLEMSSVVMGAGAGLAIAWAVVVPGDRTRAVALRETGMRSAVVMLGAMVCLVGSAIVEAFVTPSGLPTAVRLAIGVSLLGALVTFGAVRGRRMSRAGASGTFGDLDPSSMEALETALQTTA